MQIIITGGAGFLGQRLAKALLESNVAFGELILADIVMPSHPAGDKRIKCQQVDLSKEDAAKKLVTSKTTIVFHLAAVVSSHAEKDFDIGYKVNLDITRLLLEACRQQIPGLNLYSPVLWQYTGGNYRPWLTTQQQ